MAAVVVVHHAAADVALAVVQRDARRGHLAGGLPDPERADDEQRERDDAGAPGLDGLDVEAVPEAEEQVELHVDGLQSYGSGLTSFSAVGYKQN